MPLNQSDILEARDQLLLDAADASRLDVVTHSRGLKRPPSIGDDSKWRFAVKQIGLQRKLVAPALHRLMEACAGPKWARAGILAAAVAIGDETVVLEDATQMLQVGTAYLSPGLAGEEEVRVVQIERATQTVILSSAATAVHPIVAAGAGTLSAGVAAGAVALVLVDSSELPVSGYPYPVLLDQGTEVEEVVSVTNNVTGTGTLTVSATVYAHAGPTPVGGVRTTLATAAPIGRVLVELADSTAFPGSGSIRIAPGAGNVEVISYSANDADNGRLSLASILVSAHAVAESVELVSLGASVQTVSLYQPGGHWRIYEDAPRHVSLYLPPATAIRLLAPDAAWLHDSTGSASTTLAVATVSADTQLSLAASTGFPEAGLILVGGAVTVFYTRCDQDAAPNPLLQLSQPIGAVYGIGAAVALVEHAYAGTDLEDGNDRTALGVYQTEYFPGPHVYRPGTRAPGLVQSTVATLIPPHTKVAVAQDVGRTTLHVLDASLYAATMPLRVGRLTGSQEDVSAVAVTLVGTGNTTTLLAGAPADNAAGRVTLRVADSTGLPISSLGSAAAGYWLIVDSGGANEELVRVDQNPAAAPGLLTLEAPLTITHGDGETVDIISDVLGLAAALARAHKAERYSPTRVADPVDVLTSQIVLVSGVGFPATGGYVWLNFGRARPPARSRLVAKPGAALYTFDETDTFPVANYPYQVVLGEGTAFEEVALVANNVTALDQLTFSVAPTTSHALGTYCRFVPGPAEVVEYATVSGATLTLAAPIVLGGGHTIGETVMLSQEESDPRSRGDDYAFQLPPNRAACVTALIDYVRAAGVQVVVSTRR